MATLQAPMAVADTRGTLTRIPRLSKQVKFIFRFDSAWRPRSYPVRYAPRPPVTVQYQRPGMQVQVEQGTICAYFPYACQPLIPLAYALPETGFSSASTAPVQVQAQGPVAVSPQPGETRILAARANS